MAAIIAKSGGAAAGAAAGTVWPWGRFVAFARATAGAGTGRAAGARAGEAAHGFRYAILDPVTRQIIGYRD